MRVADVLPGNSGPELVFASMHGGLACYSLSLQPLYEWPEPGIVDWFPGGPYGVTLLSNRGTIAQVTFASTGAGTWTAQLQCAAKSIPVAGDFPATSSSNTLAYQGVPHDLELMQLAGEAGVTSLTYWSGDWDGGAVRRHTMSGLVGSLFLGGQGGIVDLATCRQEGSQGDDAQPGDSALTLTSAGVLSLYDENHLLLGSKNLTQSTAGDYGFGTHAHTMVVGDLVANTGAYADEVVVATNTGLMWLHVDDLMTSSSVLPANYALSFAISAGAAADTQKQPRTTRSMSAAWAMAVRPNATNPQLKDLHVVDQRGLHWSIDSTMKVRLEGGANLAATEIRSISHTGTKLFHGAPST
jgi:hypothetical protein